MRATLDNPAVRGRRHLVAMPTVNKHHAGRTPSFRAVGWLGGIAVLGLLASLREVLPQVGPVHLSGAALQNADLSWRDLTSANLNEADLRGARLHHTDLTDASLTGAD